MAYPLSPLEERPVDPYTPRQEPPYDPATGVYTIDNSSPLTPAAVAQPAPVAPPRSYIAPTAPPPSPLTASAPAPQAPAAPMSNWDILARGGVPDSWREAAAQPAAQPEKGFIGKLGQAFGGGVDTLQESFKATGNAIIGDNRAVEANAATMQQVQQAKPQEQQAFMQGVEAIPENLGFVDTVKGLGSAIWEQPQGALQEFAAQAPNSAAVIGGMVAGGKLGAMAGSVVPGIGNAIGAGVGAIIGGFLGNMGIEAGAKVIEKAEGGLTDAERGAGLQEGALKAAGVTGVDVATLGASRWLMGAPSRAASSAIMKSLTQSGVNVADDAAVATAMNTLGVGSEALLNGAREFARSAGRAPLRTAGAAVMETVGEGAGEYLGEVMATGEGSLKEALLESIMSAPMSAAEIAWSKSDASQPFKLGTALSRATGTDLRDPEAVDRYINTNLPQFAALSLDQDRLGIVTKDVAMQALGDATAPMEQRIQAIAGIAADIAVRQKLPEVSKAWRAQAQAALEKGETIEVPGYTKPIPAYQQQQQADRKREKTPVWQRDKASYPLTPEEERDSLIRATMSQEEAGPWGQGPDLPGKQRTQIDQWVNRPGQIPNQMPNEPTTGMVGGQGPLVGEAGQGALEPVAQTEPGSPLTEEAPPVVAPPASPLTAPRAEAPPEEIAAQDSPLTTATPSPKELYPNDRFAQQGLQPGTPEHKAAWDAWRAQQEEQRRKDDSERRKTENQAAVDKKNTWRKGLLSWFESAANEDKITTDQEGEEYRVIEQPVTRNGKTVTSKRLVQVGGWGDGRDKTLIEYHDGKQVQGINTEQGLDENAGWSAQPETETDSTAAVLGRLMEEGKAKPSSGQPTTATSPLTTATEAPTAQDSPLTATQAPAQQPPTVTPTADQPTTAESAPNAIQQQLAANREQRAAETAPPLAPPVTNPKARTPIYTPDGKQFAAQWEVVEADSLSPTMATGENQPRDRNRMGSDLQIQGIANNPDFKRLSDIGQTMDVGAPTLTREGVIVGGNGRVAGVSQSYNIGKAQAYRDALTARAEELGVDPAQIAGMNKPVLVRRLQDDVDVKQMALASNKSQGLAMGSTETAKVDAGRLRNLGQIAITDTGDIATTNDNIARLRDSLTDYDITEQAAFIDATGNVSADGLRRVRNAILHQAYGDSPVLTRLLETADPDLKNVSTALIRAGGKMAEMNDVITRGEVPADYAVATDMAQAIETLSQLRQTKTSLADHLAQPDIFGDQASPAEQRILQFLDDNGRSAKAITGFLEDYADRIISSKGIGQDLFGDTITPPTKDQVLADVAQRNAKSATPTSGDLFAQAPAGQAAGQSQDAGNNAPGDRRLGGAPTPGDAASGATAAPVAPTATQPPPTAPAATAAAPASPRAIKQAETQLATATAKVTNLTNRIGKLGPTATNRKALERDLKEAQAVEKAAQAKVAGHSRAPTGGGYGANGEWYPAGAFINTVPDNAKGTAKTRAATGKQQVAPGVYEAPAVAGQQSLFARNGATWQKQADGTMAARRDLNPEEYPPEVIEAAQADADRYNSGERWGEQRGQVQATVATNRTSDVAAAQAIAQGDEAQRRGQMLKDALGGTPPTSDIQVGEAITYTRKVGRNQLQVKGVVEAIDPATGSATVRVAGPNGKPLSATAQVAATSLVRDTAPTTATPASTEAVVQAPAAATAKAPTVADLQYVNIGTGRNVPADNKGRIQVRYASTDGVITVGEIVDLRKAQDDNSASPWQTSDGKRHINLATAKKHELQTKILPTLRDNGYVAGEGAAAPAVAKDEATDRIPGVLSLAESQDARKLTNPRGAKVGTARALSDLVAQALDKGASRAMNNYEFQAFPLGEVSITVNDVGLQVEGQAALYFTGDKGQYPKIVLKTKDGRYVRVGLQKPDRQGRSWGTFTSEVVNYPTDRQKIDEALQAGAAPKAEAKPDAVSTPKPEAKPTKPKVRTAYDLTDEEYQEVIADARYLKDVAYSISNLVGDDPKVQLAMGLSKSMRDTILMDALNIDRDLAHTVNNGLDDKQIHKLRKQDMEDALVKFPMLKKLVDEHAPQPAATDQQAEAVTQAETKPAPAKAATTTAAKEKTDTKLENFGEALPPRRRKLAAKLTEALSDDDISSQPLSKIWPAAENEGIEDTFAAAVAFAARAKIPSKPRGGGKLILWVEQVKLLRTLAVQIVSGKVNREQFLDMRKRNHPRLSDWEAQVRLLEQLDREHWSRIAEVHQAPDSSIWDDKSKSLKPSAYVTVKIDGQNRILSGSGEILQHLDAIKALLGEPAATKQMQFTIWSPRSGGSFYIAKNGDPEKRKLMTFDSVAEARTALRDRYADLVTAWEAVKERDNITERDLRGAVNRPRTGQDWRQGRDITTEEFAAQFGFRGGEFGKWMKQGKQAQERQAYLNSAYDALMDLADILGVPPKAISLNGTLGMAFGARGSGWAAAHYEPDTLIINLTKPHGAGALAHEWFHALDNYFARTRGNAPKFTGDQDAYRDQNFITYKPERMMVHKSGRVAPLRAQELTRRRAQNPGANFYAEENWQLDPQHPEGVRPEVEARFAALVEALNASPMLDRARRLDGRKSGEGYWSRVIERGARAFENYVMKRMLDQGYVNDFLANVLPATEIDKNDARYPYLLPDEVAPIAEAFDELLGTLQTREDDAGNMAMFSRSAPGFYSPLARGIAKAKSTAMPAGQWRNWLKANAANLGIKQAEIDAVGLEEYLTLRGTDKITREELTAYARDNGVRVEEVVKGSSDDADVAKERDRLFEAFRSGKMTRDEYEEAWSSIEEATQYGSYVLPGGQNYRELLLTLPAKLPEGWTIFEDEGNFSLLNQRGEYVTSRPTRQAIEEIAQKYASDPGMGGTAFASAHWQEKNILAHIRFNERTDADGKRVLFIEEIQSDWGQSGKKQGFADANKKRVAVRRSTGDQETVARFATGDEAQAYIDANPDQRLVSWVLPADIGPPTAPFVTDTKAWTALAIKRMIRYASENGFDRVALVTGAQSAERYYLSKQVESITVIPMMRSDNRGIQIVLAAGNGEMVLTVNPDGKVVKTSPGHTELQGKALDEVVGKEMAATLLTGPAKAEYSGEGIKVGGAGMKAYYDRIVPQVVNDLLKKLGGGKLSPMQLGRSFEQYRQQRKAVMRDGQLFVDSGIEYSEDMLRQDYEQEGGGGGRGDFTQPGFDIPQAMRDQVLNEGLPLFTKAGGATPGASPAAVRAAVNRITSKWANAPRMVVFTGMDDPQVDAAVRKEYARQTKERLAQDPNAAPDQVDAFYFRGVVYINSESIANIADVERALRHETLGHAGLRALFGNALDGILDQVIAGQRAVVEAKAKQRGLDLAKINEARTAAEEVLAELAETRPNLAVVRRAVALIRRLLREMGITLELSNNDLIAEYILPARNFIERGQRQGTGTLGAAVPAFNVSEAATAREFRETEQRYAAELRAHDKEGKPLLAPNGRRSNLNRRQWVQVRTPAFKAWFGDWEAYAGQPGGVWNDGDNSVSKVVDENGEPRVVYHGSKKAGFTVLDPNKGDQHRSPMVFTAKSSDTAATYAGTQEEAEMADSLGPSTQQDFEKIGYEFEEDGDFWGVTDPNGGVVASVDDEHTQQEALDRVIADYEAWGATYNEERQKPGLYPLFLNIRNPNERNFGGANWDGQRLDTDKFSIWDSEDEMYVDGSDYEPLTEDAAQEKYEELGGDDEEFDGRPRYEIQGAPDLDETTNSVAEEAMSAGMDGAIIQNVIDDGGQSYFSAEPDDVMVIFNANQAKSATQNTGAFSASNDDLRFSLSPRQTLGSLAGRAGVRGFAPPPSASVSGQAFGVQHDPTWVETLVYRLQDRFSSLKKVQQALGPLPEEQDPYLAETLFHGKNWAAHDDFEKAHIAPIEQVMADHKLSVAQVDEFLYARHAPEANTRLRQTNAKRFLRNLIDATADPVRQAQLEKDMAAITAALKTDPAALRDEYLTLLDQAVTQAASPAEEKVAAKWAAFRAKPSGMTDAEAETITRANRNHRGLAEIGQRIDAMTQAHIDRLEAGGLLTPQEANAWRNTYRHYVTLAREGFEDAMPKQGRGKSIGGRESQIRAGSTRRAVDILANTIARSEAGITRVEKAKVGRALYELVQANPDEDGFWAVDKDEQKAVYDSAGNVTYYPDSLEGDNQIKVKINGVQHTVTFDETNPHAMRIAAAMKNLDQNPGTLVEMLGKVNRVLAFVNTSASPEFLISNLARDVQTMIYNLQSTEAQGLARQIVKDIPAAMKGIHEALRGGTANSEWAKWWQEFEKNGGPTGWADAYRSIEARAKRIESDVSRLGGHQPRRYAHAALKLIEDYNAIVENATRLAAYRQAVERGLLSKPRAAAMAKDLTTNFNRKGASGQVVNALYLFANAGIQGSARIITALRDSPKVRSMAYTTMVAAALLAMANRGLGDEDEDGEPYYDKIPDHVKERNMIFMLPGTKGDYVKIPLPWGYNVLWAMGGGLGNAVDAALGRHKSFSATKELGSIASATLNAFNPLQSGTLLQTIAPTVLDPVVQIGENKNWAGQPLAPEQNSFDPVGEPNFERYWQSSRPISRAVAKGLSYATGGDRVQGGMIDLSPEWVDLAIDTLTGSAGRFVVDAVGTPAKALGGEELEGRDIPFARRVFGTPSPNTAQQLYFVKSQDVQTTKKKLEAYRDAPQVVRELRTKNAAVLSLAGEQKRTETILRRLRKARNAARDSGNKEREKAVLAHMNAIYTRFNKAYNHKVFGD